MPARAVVPQAAGSWVRSGLVDQGVPCCSVVTVTRKKTTVTRPEPGYDAVLADVVGLVEAARHASARTVNALITATYWTIGRRIVEQEQHGQARVDYGVALVDRLATDLTDRFGRGFGRRNLFQMRAFYLAYREILQTVSAQPTGLPAATKVQTASALRLRAALRRLGDEYVFSMLDDAIDLLPPAKLAKLVSRYLEVNQLRPDAPGKKNLLAEVRAFDTASRAGKYYESFNVNSKNFMEKSALHGFGLIDVTPAG